MYLFYYSLRFDEVQELFQQVEEFLKNIPDTNSTKLTISLLENKNLLSRVGKFVWIWFLSTRNQRSFGMKNPEILTIYYTILYSKE